MEMGLWYYGSKVNEGGSYMIAIGCDHRGFCLKEEIKRYLEEKEIEYKDFGTYSDKRMDYPTVAKEVAKSVQEKESNDGILICGTGFGMEIVANKFRGIRCAACYNEETAKRARQHNNSNVLALGADDLTTNQAICIIRAWLGTEFEGGRHSDRIKLIEEIENENMK